MIMWLLDTIRIASTSHHHKLFSELITWLFKEHPHQPAHAQFSQADYWPSSGSTLLEYHPDKNKFIANVSSIHMKGLDEATFDITITINFNNAKEEIMLQDLFLQTPWCTQVEKIEMTGKILIFKKSQLATVQNWFDDKLPKLFKNIYPKTQNLNYSRTTPYQIIQIECKPGKSSTPMPMHSKRSFNSQESTQNSKPPPHPWVFLCVCL